MDVAAAFKGEELPRDGPIRLKGGLEPLIPPPWRHLERPGLDPRPGPFHLPARLRWEDFVLENPSYKPWRPVGGRGSPSGQVLLGESGLSKKLLRVSPCSWMSPCPVLVRRFRKEAHVEGDDPFSLSGAP